MNPVVAPNAGGTSPEIAQDEREWRASVNRVRRLLQEMQSGTLGKFHDHLLPQAAEVLVSAKARDDADQVAWAKALASDVANIED